MVKINENQEAISHINMVIDLHDLAATRILEEENKMVVLFLNLL